jgi:hypothetical protein
MESAEKLYFTMKKELIMKKQHVSKVLSIILIFTFITLNFIPTIKALEISVALPASAIMVTNNKVGIDDKVEVTGLVEGDIINVYTATTGGALLGSGTVAVGQTSVTIAVPQVGAIAGGVYVSVTKEGMMESTRTLQDYTSETTPKPVATNITVMNNYGTTDTVTVAGLVEGDIVNLYSATTGGLLLGSATTGVGQTSVTITIALGPTAGYLYVSATNVNKLESLRTTKTYLGEPTVAALPTSAITVTNNKVGIDDKVEVTGLVEGDIVNVYTATTGGKLLGTETVAVGQTSVTITVPQVGETDGSVYVSVKKAGKLESARTPKTYTSETTITPVATNIIVVNNYVGTDDTVTVTALVDGDIVNIYNQTTGGILMGSATIGAGQTSATIAVPQVGATAGSIYVSVINVNKLESLRTAKAYVAEPTTTALLASSITVTNNKVGIDDKVAVIGLAEGDIVNVYTATTGGTLLGSGTVVAGQTTVTITIPQVGATAGSIYVSVTNVNKLESLRTAKTYVAEPTTIALLASAITATNNKVGIDDKVAVTGLVEGDIIKVYTLATGGTLLGSGTVVAGQTTVTITIPQVGTTAGSIYVSVTNVKKLESLRTAKTYVAEPTTIALLASVITATNNKVGIDDKVAVTGLVEGDIIKVYTLATGGTLLGSGTVVAGQTAVTITIPQVGSTAGSIYVSVTNLNKLESLRTTKAYVAEPTTTALLASAIAVTNNKVGVDDKITVTGLVEGDIIKVYTLATGGTVLGGGTVAVGQTSIIITVPQVGALAGIVYTSVKRDGNLESVRTPKAYTSETTLTPIASNITVVNNYIGIDDVVTVTGLVGGDIVNIYNATTGGTLLGSATIVAGQTSATIKVAQVGLIAGSVYVSVTNVNKLESLRVAKPYLAEPTKMVLPASAITVTNNKVGIDDKIVVTGFAEGYIINVYTLAIGGTLLGSGTISVGQTSLTITVPQVGALAGSVYISVKKDGKLESARTPKAYTSETTLKPVSTNITVVNNYIGTDDKVTVAGLVDGDIVNVYNLATGGTLLGSATIGVGQTAVTITVAQLGSIAGSVYVSVTNVNKLESLRTARAYVAEPTTTALLASAITVTNNKIGIDDKVVVIGLVEGDIIKVYTAATGGTVLGSATVAIGQTSVTITVPQVGVLAGSVYISVKKDGKLESARTPKAYTSETTLKPVSTNITVVNNYIGTNDTVTVVGLVAGDIVNVYNVAIGGTLLGSATIGVGQTSVTIAVAQLGSIAGSVYVSVTNVNKLESLRTARAHVAEPTTTALLASSITVTNNKVGIDDKVVVIGLVEGDIIKIYTAATGGTVLGSGTVAVGQTSVTITVPQVGALAGSVYISVKKAGKLESVRTTKSFKAE